MISQLLSRQHQKTFSLSLAKNPIGHPKRSQEWSISTTIGYRLSGSFVGPTPAVTIYASGSFPFGRHEDKLDTIGTSYETERIARHKGFN